MWLWEQVLSKVAERIPAQHFEIWFRPTALQGVDEQRKEFHVLVPNQHFRYWLKEKYQRVLTEVFQEVRLGDWSVCFTVEEDAASAAELLPDVRAGMSSDEVESVQGLNSRYSFDSFVVGSSNQFAHAAAEAVANQPACSYNPLFIYGGVGLGKTHLMHAIGHRIRTQAPHLRLAYISSESFVNELIHAIRFDYDRMVQFREKYRSFDVLLMDDIQFLAGKERTQEEFFHTFNALYDAQRQIVVSSDAPPRSIPTLEERLHSRFEWGLIADIQPPDLETKIAILRRKADAKGVALDDEVILFIAANIKSNIRELEGALVRLVAYSSLTGDAINLGLAQRVLHNLVEQQTRVITIGQIQRSVAEHYQLRISELKAKDNSRRVAEPRQIAMYLSKELTQNSLSEIGREFGGKHHTTVIHAIRKVERQQQDDPKLKATLNRLMESIR